MSLHKKALHAPYRQFSLKLYGDARRVGGDPGKHVVARLLFSIACENEGYLEARIRLSVGLHAFLSEVCLLYTSDAADD